MICEECKRLGEESTVRSVGSSRTLLDWSPGYYNTDGEWVPNEDPNKTTTYWVCSNGHRFVTVEGSDEQTLLP